MPSPQDITGLLDDWSRGDPRALDRLLPVVYGELRRIASRQPRARPRLFVTYGESPCTRHHLRACRS